ncbi:MAG: hypothetical protein RR214_01545 [Synergistaceae bacterium]
MKKIFAAMVVVLVFAGAALAYPCDGGMGRGHGGMGPGNVAMNKPELRAKAVEMRNLHEELRVELRRSTPDNAKVKLLHGKILDLRDELSDIMFKERLANPGKGMRGDAMTSDFTPEMKAKVNEAAKLRGDLRAEFAKTAPNKTAALSMHDKLRKLEREISEARFEIMLKNPEKYKECPMFDGGGHRGPGRACPYSN